MSYISFLDIFPMGYISKRTPPGGDPPGGPPGGVPSPPGFQIGGDRGGVPVTLSQPVDPGGVGGFIQNDTNN